LPLELWFVSQRWATCSHGPITSYVPHLMYIISWVVDNAEHPKSPESYRYYCAGTNTWLINTRLIRVQMSALAREISLLVRMEWRRHNSIKSSRIDLGKCSMIWRTLEHILAEVNHTHDTDTPRFSKSHRRRQVDTTDTVIDELVVRCNKRNGWYWRADLKMWRQPWWWARVQG
jgi:hypothetical protein